MANLPVYGITDFSSDEKIIGFYANDLRTHLQSHQFVNNPHRHNTYITILFTKGTGEHKIDFNTYKVKPGSVFLLSPGQAHNWKLSADADGFVFFHTAEFYNSVFIIRKIEDFPFFYLSSNYPVVYFNPKENETIENLFQTIYSDFKTSLPLRNQKLIALIDLVYIELSRKYTSEKALINSKTTNYSKIKKLCKLIDEQYKSEKSATYYADKMNMTTRHLSRICQEFLNKSTTQLITERILLEAKRLLLHTNIPISRVAEELGYNDYSYFIRFFKTNEGCTPKEFQALVMN